LNTILKDELLRHATDAIQSPVVAKGAVLTTTTGTGLGMTFDWITFSDGFLLMALSGMLTALLIYGNWRRIQREKVIDNLRREKLELEIEKLKEGND
jgi:hypothetical protein